MILISINRLFTCSEVRLFMLLLPPTLDLRPHSLTKQMNTMKLKAEKQQVSPFPDRVTGEYWSRRKLDYWLEEGWSQRRVAHRPTAAQRQTFLEYEENRENLPGHASPLDSVQKKLECGGETRWVELLHIQGLTQSPSSSHSMVVPH